MCSCFRARKRATIPTVLEEQKCMDLSSTMEMSLGQEVVPPSLLRVPPSPSRYYMPQHPDGVDSGCLSLSQVVRATHNFSESMKIGEGGFGMVYKAELPNGQFVAVKRAKKELLENLQTQLRSEVELLSKIEHWNLVKLLGFVDEGNELLLITEYVPNGTLREHLDGLHGRILEFTDRLEISIDVARALTYLHLYAEKPIIHGDVKSSNILLTEKKGAKVADFGFAKLGDLDRTYYSTEVKATVGYLDPEYMKTNQPTAKSDVYSFGVLLLEILSGHRPVDMTKPRFWELLDSRMKESVDMEIKRKMYGLAIQCAAPTGSDRPDMKKVVEQLVDIRDHLIRQLSRRG